MKAIRGAALAAMLGLGACAQTQPMMAQPDVVVCHPGMPCHVQPIGAVTAELDGDRSGPSMEAPESARGLVAAAEGGSPNAQYRLATLLFRGGEGFRRQPYAALQWMRRAAESGDVRAQRAVGRLYMTGLEEMGQDPREARNWLSMAASRGDRAAARDLAEMDRAERAERDFLRALALRQAETRVLWVVVVR
ncbi:hypothetical protein VQH23_18725 [Pararoseomonas sp. SCSIO 73927]|uniref:tetratricopeptide repeat protein n=1 Tax=Pararoseomonas sp. SCSIO 73927 TaxID=3114537 RepID=UPI0030CF9D6C